MLERLRERFDQKRPATIFMSNSALLESLSGKIFTFFVAFSMPFTLLTHDLIWEYKEVLPVNSDVEFFSSVFWNPNFIWIFVISAGIGLFLTSWSIWNIGDTDGITRGIHGSSIVILIYFLSVSVSRYATLTEIPTPSSSGLIIVQILLYLLFSKRISSDLSPPLIERSQKEVFIENTRYIDRIVLSFGAGVLIAVLFSIAPTGSSLVFRVTLVLLIGPIVVLLLGVIAVGVLRIKRLEMAMSDIHFQNKAS